MHTKDVIAAIGRMPREFRRRKDVSMVALLKESGYLRARSEVTVATLQIHFASHQEDLDGWVSSSRDNRSSPAWYVVEPRGSDATWVVGRHPGSQREHFENGAEACAVYVNRWLDFAASIAERAS